MTRYSWDISEKKTMDYSQRRMKRKTKSKTPNAEEIPKLNTPIPLSDPKSAHSTPG
jgi:hypothetical protein